MKAYLTPDEKILLYLTGNAMKYFDAMEIKRDETPALNRDANSLAQSLDKLLKKLKHAYIDREYIERIKLINLLIY